MGNLFPEGKKEAIVMRFKRFSIICFFVLVLVSSVALSEEERPSQISFEGRSYPLYPETMDLPPGLPSPYLNDEGLETVVVITGTGKYAILPVTVENGEPWMIENKRGKGNQLKVDAEDFPYLAKTGLHSEIELEDIKRITGKSLAEITENGRPERSSGVGFMAQEEDIISVLKGDNRLVRRMGLTHPDLARPVFHVFNVIRLRDEWERNLGTSPDSIDYLLYNGVSVRLIGWQSGHGWQESIFNDEIRGFYQIDFSRDLESFEKSYLMESYSHLTDDHMREMLKKLSTLHIGEMAAFYIMRYGFYEGHTGYRADPIALAFIFRLRSIEEIDKALNGRLYEALTEIFTEDRLE
jgi:hypothetical protein